MYAVMFIQTKQYVTIFGRCMLLLQLFVCKSVFPFFFKKTVSIYRLFGACFSSTPRERLLFKSFPPFPRRKHKHKKSNGLKSCSTPKEMVNHFLIFNTRIPVTTRMKFPFVSMEFQSEPSFATIAS